MRGQAANGGVVFECLLEIRTEGGQVKPGRTGSTWKAPMPPRCGSRQQLPSFTAPISRRRPAGTCARDGGRRRSRYAALREAHVAEHRRLFRRVELDLGGPDRSAVPTDERLAAVEQGGDDPQLLATVLPVRPLPADVAARGPAALPANLQGIVGRGPDAALAGRLSRQHQYPDELLAGRGLQPLRMPRAAVRFHRHAARAGPPHRAGSPTAAAAGWCTTRPTCGAARRSRAPRPYAMWQGASGWLAQHLWEHYAFTGDREFLRERA